MKNIQYLTLNDTTLSAKLCMSIVTKVGLAQKGHDLMECNRLSLQQGINQLLYLKGLVRGQRYNPRQILR